MMYYTYNIYYSRTEICYFVTLYNDNTQYEIYYIIIYLTYIY